VDPEYYIDVFVGDASYHGSEALTYRAAAPLSRGQLVVVPLRNKQVLGLVSAMHTPKPSFTVKPAVVLGGLPPLPEPLMQLLVWFQAYYPAPLGLTTQLVLPRQLPKKPTSIDTLPALQPLNLPPCTADQIRAIQAMQNPGLHLLHGETGSGKTRVYVELAAQQLAMGKSVIMLTPEIGLTSQLADNFTKAFGPRVLTLHSQLSNATRERLWQYVLAQPEPMVVIGARSALFSPLKNVGLIVVDESHETAYKQDQAPYYHTTTVAAKLASLNSATLILGSATPLVSDYYIATAKQRPIIRMTQSAKETAATPVTVVDIRARDQFTKSPHLSNALIASMREALARKEQALLFLNRRGTARVIFCEACGWQALCPHCDVPLIYHGDSHTMRCHTCEYRTASPVCCPVCRSASVIFKSIGTKAIVDEAARLFPEARIMRFDTDNKKDERIERQYEALRDGHADIIVGTQSLAKGLDLPGLSVVGVIVADTGLFFPDFSAQERTYQLLRQVLGRVGRGHRDGRAIVQTYAPDSPLLRAALSKNWEDFYNKELAERRQFNFPPFCYLLQLTCKRASSNAAQKAAEIFTDQIRRTVPGVLVEGPSPSFHEKIQGKYGWQIVVKARRRDHLLTIIKNLPSGWSYDIDPMNLL